MQKFLMLVVLWCIGTQPAFAAQETLSPQDMQYGEWMQYYYLQKDVSKIGDFLKWVQNNQIIEKHETSKQPIAAFLSVIFLDNPTQVENWIKSVDFVGKTKETIEYALWLSGNEKLIAKVFKDTPEYAKSTFAGIKNLTPKQAMDLDIMWGAFYASGDEHYVKKIIDTLDETKLLTGEKTEDIVTRGAARWSLSSNMLQHELVNRIIRKEMNVRPETIKQKLKEIAEESSKKIRHFPNQVGDFSAALVIIGEKELAEYGKPSNETLYLNEVLKAKRGDILAIKIAYSGMDLTESLMADVTFDLKILAPDGTIYDNTDLKDMEALKIKTPRRFAAFHNRTFLKIRFEPHDKLGKYRIISEVHDNIGKKKILLSKEVDLLQ
jgi:hypothetical protein